MTQMFWCEETSLPRDLIPTPTSITVDPKLVFVLYHRKLPVFTFFYYHDNLGQTFVH